MTRKILYIVTALWVLAFISQTCAHAEDLYGQMDLSTET